MAFDDTSADSGAISQINVTPLVDVMLVLLVIFMVAAPMLQEGVELQLPKESVVPLEGQGEKLVLSITVDGDVFIGKDNKLALEQVGPKLKAIVDVRSDKSVYIRADRRVDYGTVMAVMARLRRAGIDKVGLMTDPQASYKEDAFEADSSESNLPGSRTSAKGSRTGKSTKLGSK
jgi:biopolymer transport protein TolR